MQKLFPLILIATVFLLISCHSENNSSTLKNNLSDTVNIFPVTSFLKAQLKLIDTLPVTPLKIITENGKSDSTWLKRDEIRSYATPFLTPEIDSTNMASLFSEKSFLDQTVNAYTFSYDAKTKLPDSIHLTHWDVYMNPQTQNIDRIYMVKEKNTSDTNSITQLTWLVNKWFSIRTITQLRNQQPKIKEEKLIWDFD